MARTLTRGEDVLPRISMPVSRAIALSLLAISMVSPAFAQSQPSWLVPDLAAAAKAEGELTIYGSMNEEEALPYWQLFQAGSGVKALLRRQHPGAHRHRVSGAPADLGSGGDHARLPASR